MPSTRHYPAFLIASLLFLGSISCGGDSGDGGNGTGPPDPDSGILLATGSFPAYLIAADGDLFWSETSETPVRVRRAQGTTSQALSQRFSVPIGLTLTSNDLFWTGSRSGFSPSGCAGPDVTRTLNRTDRSTGQTTLLAIEDSCGLFATGDVIVVGGQIFWATAIASPNTYTLRSMPVGGGTSVPVATAMIPIVALKTDGANLYWMENGQTEGTNLRRIPVVGGSTVTLATTSGSRTHDFAINGTDAFFTRALYPTGEEVLRVSLAGGAPVPVDTLVSTPSKLAVDVTQLYLGYPTGIAAIPVTGGDETPLATTSDPLVDLLLDGSTVLWSESSGPAHGETGTIQRVPAIGGPVTTELADGGDAPRELAVDPSGIYWTEGGPIGWIEGVGQIGHLIPGGGGVDTVASGVLSDTPPIAVAGGYVFVADRWRIKRFPRAGGRVQTVTRADDRIESLATDGTNVYWVQGGLTQAYRAPASGGAPVLLGTPPPGSQGPAGPIYVEGGNVYWMSDYSAILRVPTTGGAVEPVATDLPFVADFVVDADHVYFSETDTGDIKRISVSGGAATMLASSLRGSYITLAQDATSLYWIDQVLVGRVAKSGGGIAYINPDPLAADPFTPASIAALPTEIAWTHPPIGYIQVVPK
jgi:hypothetical protein